MRPLKLMLVAGEASGDQHAADLAKALRQRSPGIQLFGLGGDLMERAGVEVVHNLVRHAVIGFFEALRKLGDFARILQQAKALLSERRPDAVVLTDLPDLNFRIAAQAKALGIPVVYYISPQVWAWRAGRVKTLKRLVDRMIVIFPFEEPIYQNAGVPVTFVGHPLLDSVKPEEEPAQARRRLLKRAQGPLIALAPGSRKQEIELLLPTMARAAKVLLTAFPQARFFVPLARTIPRAQVESILKAEGLKAEIVIRKPFAARAAADLTIISSGTATLETAILGVPMLIVYRMHPLSYWLARMFVKLPYFGLANIALGRQAAPEFLQDGFNVPAVVAAAKELLTRPQAARAQRQAWAQVKRRLGGPGAAGRAAQAVLDTVAQAPR